MRKRMVSFDLISDLHLDFWKEIEKITINPLSNTLLVAGDSCNGIAGFFSRGSSKFSLAKKLSSIYEQVIVVLGNHDYYGEDFFGVAEKFERLCKEQGIQNIKLLNDEVLEFEDVSIFGSTFFTDYGGKGRLYAECYKLLPDLKRIRYKQGSFYKRLRTVDFAAKSAESEIKIKDFIKSHKNKNKLIITHYCPVDQLGADYEVRYKERGSFTIEAYKAMDFHSQEKVNSIIENNKDIIWVFGHVHQSRPFCKNINGNLFASNTIGYCVKSNEISPLKINVSIEDTVSLFAEYLNSKADGDVFESRDDVESWVRSEALNFNLRPDEYRVRVVKRGSIITADFRLDRLHIRLSKDNKVEEVLVQ